VAPKLVKKLPDGINGKKTIKTYNFLEENIVKHYNFEKKTDKNNQVLMSPVNTTVLCYLYLKN
jgi:hypothetical protein